MILLASALALTPPEEVPCTALAATPATVADIGERLEYYLGRCVTVSGPATSLALFSSVEGIYRSQRLTAEGNPDPGEARRHRLGLFSRNNAIRGLRLDRVPWMTVTGRVDSCERKRDRAVAAARAAGEVAVFVGAGYCHYYTGAVVNAVAFSVDRSKAERRITGEAARSEFGDLVSAPDDWPHLAALRRTGEDFRMALARGDKAALAQMHDETAKSDGQYSALVESLAAAGASPFAELRRDPSLPMAVFIRRSDLERARAGRPPEEPFGTICFARRRAASTAWPISANDADNDPARSYACTSVVWRDWTARRIGLDTRRSRGGWLAEPVPFN
ncbi:MAG: hypothetical protein ACXW27_11615 [Allosphingosinicella sp.]